MIRGHSPQIRHDGILSSNSPKTGKITGCIHPMLEKTCIVYLRIVFYVQVCIEFQTRTEVPFPKLIIESDNRSNAPPRLTAIQMFVGHLPFLLVQPLGRLRILRCSGFVSSLFSRICFSCCLRSKISCGGRSLRSLLRKIGI